mmetsp:Transcript_37562/g.82264  ORF Transcript_37562/g.82264 Transcript_37562/m.82264 type:complete len:355 (+) Transcript_37562:73-1137(+)
MPSFSIAVVRRRLLVVSLLRVVVSLLLGVSSCDAFLHHNSCQIQQPAGQPLAVVSAIATAGALPYLDRCRHMYAFRKSSRLFGIAEWRDAGTTNSVASQQQENDTNTAGKGRAVLMLPFAASDILLEGQSTTVVLKEGRFYDLFQDCIDDHQSVVGMAIMGDDGLLDVMPLCEISDFDVDAGFRGKVTITVTLRAVGRASIVELTQMKPVMMGRCVELVDELISDANATKELVRDAESTIRDMSDDLRRRYVNAYDLALETDTNERIVTWEKVHSNEADGSSDIDTIENASAVSWALIDCTCIPNKPMLLAEALASTSITHRLQIGLKALLDERYEKHSKHLADEREVDDSSFQ